MHIIDLDCNEHPIKHCADRRSGEAMRGDPTDWRGRLVSWFFVGLMLALVAIALHDVTYGMPAETIYESPAHNATFYVPSVGIERVVFSDPVPTATFALPSARAGKWAVRLPRV